MYHKFDIHTHHPAHQAGVLEIESRYFGQPGIPRAARLSVGLHPWYLRGVELDAAETWLLDQVQTGRVAAIGEAGLDHVCDIPMAQQMPAFELCAQVSERLQLPLVIHCVRAFDEVLQCKKQWKPEQPWILHGFDKHPQTAKMMLDAGFYLSFGAALLRANSRAGEALRQTPPEQFFLETDDQQVDIQTIYEHASDWRDLRPEMLEKQLQENVARVFGTRIFAP